jgi:Domain of unknown function (DUF1338)
MEIGLIFKRLWQDYSTQNPSPGKINALFRENGEEVLNDHVAFRTIGDERVNIDVMAKIFVENGYVPKGEYKFKQKHLFARHYEHPTELTAPKVFISELLLDELSVRSQQIMRNWLECVNLNLFQSDNIIYAGNPGFIPSFTAYNTLREESEYAAWLYVYGFRVNHFTVSVDSLKYFSSISMVNNYLKSKGYILNTIGGEIKGKPDDLLEQSSTLADIIPVNFIEGIHEIPGCYYEFAKRYPDKYGNIYTGFLEKSADKIFESTDFYEKKNS